MNAGKIKTDLRDAQLRVQTDRSYGAYSALANLVAKFDSKESGLQPLRLAVLRNYTVEPMIPVLNGELAVAGFHPEIYTGDFDAISRDAFDPASPLYSFKPEVIVVSQWLETLAPDFINRFVPYSQEATKTEVDRIITGIVDNLSAIRRNTSVPILVNNFPLLGRPTLGVLDAQGPWQTGALLELNRLLLSACQDLSDVYVVDLFGTMAFVGAEEGFDERYWQMGRAPLGKKILIPFGREHASLIRALNGKSRKCLVLDCDNTLWGGIIGEDGLEGIQLGSSHPGSCFVSFQKEILNLHDRGVILALCSKNNEADVLDVLRNHPDMVLREKHLATFQVNWDDKATNLQRIANDLNIGLDSFVFMDDSKFECDLVRERLPQVTVVQMPKGSHLFRRELAQGAFFDSLSFSNEDRKRNQMYGGELKRKAIQKSSGSLQEYLEKLELVAEIGRPTSIELPRVAQLTQKTNQFNLTTIRYTETQIQGFIEDKGSEVFYLKLRDKIDDMGLVAVAIISFQEKHAEIDSLLMSCRALGRGVEDAFLAYVLNQIRLRLGDGRVTARYVTTSKNQLVTDFYKKAGFSEIENSNNGSVWGWEVATGSLPHAPWVQIIEK